MAATTYRIKKHGPTFRLSRFATASGESAEVEQPEVYSSFHTCTDALLALALTGAPANDHEFLTAPIPGTTLGVFYKRPNFAQDYLGTDIA